MARPYLDSQHPYSLCLCAIHRRYVWCMQLCVCCAHTLRHTHTHTHTHWIQSCMPMIDASIFILFSVCSDTLKNEPGKSGSVKVYNYLLQQFPGENINWNACASESGDTGESMKYEIERVYYSLSVNQQPWNKPISTSQLLQSLQSRLWN
jgi:hypothetical protein